MKIISETPMRLILISDGLISRCLRRSSIVGAASAAHVRLKANLQLIPRSLLRSCLLIFLGALLAACGSEQTGPVGDADNETIAAKPEKGPHGGRLLVEGDFTLELSIFETGVPPEFRAWATQNGQALSPEKVDLTITLTRLGGKVDQIKFRPHGDALRGDTVIYEPHSFIVTIHAISGGVEYRWQYDNFEGRTKIETAVAEALGIETMLAGPVVLQETIIVYGQIRANPERVRKVSARFDGLIKSVSPSLGDRVQKGQNLATVESNESLKLYTIEAPVSGVITGRDANPGEQTDGRLLFTIMDTSSVWVELAVFPNYRRRVHVGAPVIIESDGGGPSAKGKISRINVTAEASQVVKAHVLLDNKKDQFFPGSFVSAQIIVGEHPVSLAVKRTGLQAFRDFTVVYVQIGEEYEVRMLELGRQDAEWVEVLAGLEPGSRYVSKNSYIIKADIEKSGASHDH